MRNRALTQTASRRDFLRTAGLASGAVVLGGSGLAGQAVAGEPAPGSVPGRASTLEIVGDHDHDAGEHVFEFSSTEIPSGWTTITFDNRSSHTHFVYIAKLPQVAIDGALAADMGIRDYYHEQVTEPFQGLMDLILGKEPRHDPTLPAWLFDVLGSGGPGLTQGPATSTTTVHLDPGEYIVECYVKTDDNVFHSYLGMLEHLTVTGDEAGAPEPRSTLDVTVSNTGLVAPDAVRPGQHTVGVTLPDQMFHGNFAGHDAHLVRLDGDTTLQAVSDWMDWQPADGLVSDGSEPTTFLGGADTIVTPGLLEGTGSATSYFHVNLQPGDYAWVSEVNDPLGRGYLQPFSVPGDE